MACAGLEMSQLALVWVSGLLNEREGGREGKQEWGAEGREEGGEKGEGIIIWGVWGGEGISSLCCSITRTTSWLRLWCQRASPRATRGPPCSSQRCWEPARRLPRSGAPASAPPACSPVPARPGDVRGPWPPGATNRRITPVPTKPSLRCTRRPRNVANIKEPSEAGLRFLPGVRLPGWRAGKGGAGAGPAATRDSAPGSPAWVPAPRPPASRTCVRFTGPRGPVARGGPLAELGSWCVQLPCPSPAQGQVRAGREAGRVGGRRGLAQFPCSGRGCASGVA